MTDRTALRRWWGGVSPAVLTVGTFLVAAVLIGLRRPDQIRFPEAWNEDGAYIVPLLVEHGWRQIFVPVNGYLIVSSKVVSYLAVLISFVHYPAVSTAFGILVQAACVTVVARAPTLLPAPAAMAAALVFMPTTPETFALPEYALWWTPILIFVALLWSGGPGSPWPCLFVIVGGLSSPVIMVLLPALALHAAVRRRKQEVLVLIAAVVVAAAQAYSVLTTDLSSANTFRAALVPLAFQKFFGLLTWPGQRAPVLMASLIVALVAAGVLLLPKEDRLPYGLLGACLIGTIAASVYRAPIEILNPVDAGPRYFFYPFLLELWMLLWLVARSPGPWKALPAVVLLGVAPLSYLSWQMRQERLKPWARNAIACSAGADITFRVHHDGIRRHAHSVFYPHAVCEKAVKSSMLDWLFVPAANSRGKEEERTGGGRPRQ